MKKYILILFIFTLLFPTVHAGERDWHFGFSPATFFNPSSRTLRYGGVISLEKQLHGRNFMEYSLTATGNNQTKDFLKESELIFAGYYKPVMNLGKNSYSLFKLGPNMGFGKRFLFGFGAGFEYDIILKSRIKLFISQDNLLVFRGDDRFSCGVSIGIKLPL